MIGAATLVVERKFIHGCGRVGRVEDVVVSVNIYIYIIHVFILASIMNFLSDLKLLLTNVY